jgi:hypothetical protein
VIASVPGDGALVHGVPFLVLGADLLRWTAAGYVEPSGDPRARTLF